MNNAYLWAQRHLTAIGATCLAAMCIFGAYSFALRWHETGWLSRRLWLLLTLIGLGSWLGQR
jgi:hypothetical protein